MQVFGWFSPGSFEYSICESILSARNAFSSSKKIFFWTKIFYLVEIDYKGPSKRDWRVCKGTCTENYGEPPKRQTPVRGYWLGPTYFFLRGNEKWWNMMKHDEAWWKVMISSCFIMFHHVSSFCIQAQFGWEIFNFHPEGVWLFAFGQPFWLQI